MIARWCSLSRARASRHAFAAAATASGQARFMSTKGGEGRKSVRRFCSLYCFIGWSTVGVSSFRFKWPASRIHGGGGSSSREFGFRKHTLDASQPRLGRYFEPEQSGPSGG